ncbi:Npt1/Npt2 family nucleotide transporter [Halobacteriovorax sp. ZH4_bin.1]|uniref:Npt1/Npt2 family nucleotide transporter n=1 Tax=unclassified Halobacteriovorax TaxID=2639665 RepID=UPI00372234EA
MKNIITAVKEINAGLFGLSQDERRNILLVTFTLFLAFFSYPMIRSSSTALFIQNFGAKSTPWIWLSSVMFLGLSVSIINELQKYFSIAIIFNGIVAISLALMGGALVALGNGFAYGSGVFAVWKEVYIILVVHLSLGYLNSVIDFRVAKLVYGPLGALGSLGGIFGGLLTTKLMKGMGVYYAASCGLLILALVIVIFSFTQKQFLALKEKSPISSLADKKLYVFFICGLIILSQVVINLANYKFNLGLEVFKDANEKGAYLGNIYSSINAISLIVQIIIIPIAFKYFKVSSVHIFIPFVFFILIILDRMEYLGLLGTAILFVGFKGLDYSIFSAAKEMLYFPLSKEQKYGAKYIVDMVVYRASKMGISALLLVFTSLAFTQNMLIISVLLWLVLAAFMAIKFRAE